MKVQSTLVSKNRCSILFLLIIATNVQIALSSPSLPATLLQAASNSLLLQREASALAGQPVQPGQAAAAQQQQQAKWPAGGASTAAVSSEQLSLELHQVEREIGKRTREMALVRGGGLGAVGQLKGMWQSHLAC